MAIPNRRLRIGEINNKVKGYTDTSNTERAVEAKTQAKNAIKRIKAGKSMEKVLINLWDRGYDYGYEEKERDEAYES